MPGYTHLQRAQPITVWPPPDGLRHDAPAGSRPSGRLPEADELSAPSAPARWPERPIPPTGVFEARKLGFDDIARNSIDGVSDRDFCVELMSAVSILMMHL